MGSLAEWLHTARQKHRDGQLTEADFDSLHALLDAPPRQQILYLQATTISPLSHVVGMTLLIPGESHNDYTLDPTEFPYQTVMEAVEDGWRVVQFPTPPTDFSDDTVDYLGFEFVLEKWGRV